MERDMMRDIEPEEERIKEIPVQIAGDQPKCGSFSLTGGETCDSGDAAKPTHRS